MPLKTHQDDQPSLNLTPMIDIVFLLIIFFMVGTKFTELHDAEQRIPLKVPTVSNAGTLTSAPSKRTINVYRDGTLSFDGKDLTREELQRQLAQAHAEYPQVGIVVRGDADGKFQYVADVLATCRAAGISNFAISVQLQSVPTASRRLGESDTMPR